MLAFPSIFDTLLAATIWRHFIVEGVAVQTQNPCIPACNISYEAKGNIDKSSVVCVMPLARKNLTKRKKRNDLLKQCCQYEYETCHDPLDHGCCIPAGHGSAIGHRVEGVHSAKEEK